MKGLELPVNMIIVIALAVLVLVVIAAFFATQTGSGFNTIALESSFSSACNQLRTAYSCGESGLVGNNIRAQLRPGDSDTKEYTLADLCNMKNLATTPPINNACYRSCGCT
jgi:hypothetical protein